MILSLEAAVLKKVTGLLEVSIAAKLKISITDRTRQLDLLMNLRSQRGQSMSLSLFLIPGRPRSFIFYLINPHKMSVNCPDKLFR